MDERERPIWIADDPVNNGPEMAILRADHLRELERSIALKRVALTIATATINRMGDELKLLERAMSAQPDSELGTIVRELAETEPHTDDEGESYCFFCGAPRTEILVAGNGVGLMTYHDSDCLWVRAKGAVR